MVPSLTTRGKKLPFSFSSLKWSRAPLLPPVPSKKRRPPPMWPSERLSHKFSVAPLFSQTQSFGCGLIFLVAGNCTIVLEYLDSLRSVSASHLLVASMELAPWCATTASHTSDTIIGRSGQGRGTVALVPDGSTTSSDCSFTTSHLSSRKPPETPIASFVGSSCSDCAGFCFSTRRCFSTTYRPPLPPERSTSSPTASAPKPCHDLRLTARPPSLKGVSKVKAHSSLYTLS
mmetsp:Transcript_69297/g.196442  ORF Transcript_69297/g.196442 Transcript_69297/m.196442 type:complete len:231 (+) Transcript_69297:1272-1964(+)